MKKISEINLPKKDIEMLQKMTQEFREYINSIDICKEDKMALFLASSVQFTIYALVPDNNNRFTTCTGKEWDEVIKTHNEWIEQCKLATFNDNN